MAQLRRLSSWYQTVWLVEEAAGDWNNSELYVDMWAAVCRHAAALGSTADPRDWREGCDQWGDTDRRVLDGAAGRSAAGDEWLDGGIWERAIGTLGALKQRILELMSRAINKNTVDQLRAYRKKADWASRGADACVDVDVSSELGGLLLGLAQLVAELTDLMPFAGSTYLLRSLAAELDGFLVERVAGAHPFNASGGRQFAMDVGALGRILLSPARPRNQHGPQRRMLPRAAECARILSCSLDGDSVSPSEIPLPLSGWASAVIDPTVDDGEVAQVLTKLGLTCLPLEDVRRLIGRRVDFGATYGGRAQD
ncbi:hypothetical protein LPJ61_004371 [Coemansia biformis]|uniref:Uncharacterized protein n=1 Tax=Coemansia biformis TaxID=1286918 RepID=A0A9W7YAY9_9FUNG|nr:hypothetical protein LPJ61_004371 [Coemansia biformis]